MMATLFWVFMFVVVYTYVGYPIVLFVVSKIFNQKVQKATILPKVSVIMSAFNEEKFIEKKLLNLLSLDYPEEKLEILVGSDGASDETDVIISKFHSPRIRFFRFVKNFGKPHVLNSLIEEEAGGEILLFTDARQRLANDAIKKLVENFNDHEVGCVSGELHFESDSDESIGKGMDAYWKYEKFLRKKESDIGSMLGATGAIYAIRRELYKKVPEHVLVDDMYIPFAIIEKGYRAIFEPQAKAFDQVSKKGKQEFKRKVRTLAGNYQIFQQFPGFFNPFKSPISWQLVSHKFLRLMIPFLLVAIGVLNIVLATNPFYLVLLIGQILFYGLAFTEAVREQLYLQNGGDSSKRKKGLGYVPYTFCVLNYSAFMGCVQFLTQKGKKGGWEKAYA